MDSGLSELNTDEGSKIGTDEQEAYEAVMAGVETIESEEPDHAALAPGSALREPTLDLITGVLAEQEDTTEGRIKRLEARTSINENETERLEGIIASQANTISNLQQSLALLVSRVAALELRASGDGFVVMDAGQSSIPPPLIPPAVHGSIAYFKGEYLAGRLSKSGAKASGVPASVYKLW